VDLHVSLAGRRNLSGQVYRQIREAILTGRIRAGDCLPPSRELADRIGVSRNTVLVVYDRLRSEGFLETRIGSGTFVGADVRPRAPSGVTDSPLRARTLWDRIGEGPDLSASDPPFDLRPGIPDAARFPFAPWRARMSRQLRPRAVGRGAHIGPAGHPALREALAGHVGVSRAVRARPDDVFVTNGSQQALDLIARVLLEPGDAVALEDPGYPLARRAFQAQGLRVVPVPVDEEGLVVDAIPEGVRLVYVTPSHQYPLGVALSMERRQALLAWARSADAAIVEDDYDSEFRYDGRPLETLHGLDGSGRVLYVGSLSKVMLPTLRLGFVVAPPSLHAALRKAKAAMDWHTAVPVQAAAAEFIGDGLLAKHVRRMRRMYAERHRCVVATLEQRFDGRLTPLPSNGGLHLTAVLEASVEPRVEPPVENADLAIAERAEAEGVAVLPLSRHYLAAPLRQGLLIGYGAIEADRITEALGRLGRCLDGAAARAGAGV
jgi:GntR family transcriptional regulator/MocR family aminotransferase